MSVLSRDGDIGTVGVEVFAAFVPVGVGEEFGVFDQFVGIGANGKIGGSGFERGGCYCRMI